MVLGALCQVALALRKEVGWAGTGDARADVTDAGVSRTYGKTDESSLFATWSWSYFR